MGGSKKMGLAAAALQKSAQERRFRALPRGTGLWRSQLTGYSVAAATIQFSCVECMKDEGGWT